MAWIASHAPVETEADLPKYCGKCGRAMQPDPQTLGHDRMTGSAIVAPGVRCPKGRFDSWNRHEAYVVSPRPPAPPMPHRKDTEEYVPQPVNVNPIAGPDR